ncbi:hypothetical protein J4E85_002703 [Alternaria conjuncta]|uniref:uncharacterized protein n=1 Tax=Alternaria conjuncta TaxID=181017 RepID=UPI00221E64DD|nr:uncharacterized protein J4E85_002703 [Alternaria conjuncta]KAI4934842.1 hypothetical protein J4E85_002703 [Alternaria conjuncta]
MSGNLIDLSDEGTSSQNTTGINGIHRTNGLVGRMSLSENRARSPPRNHFAGLDVLMRQRQSSTPVPSPAPRPVSLPTVASVPRFATRLASSSEMFSPLAQPYRAPESVASFLQEQQEPLTSALRSDQPIPEYIPENRMEFRSMIDTINDYDKTADSESDHRSGRSSWSPPVHVPHIESSVPAASDTPPTPADSVVHAIHDFEFDQPTMVRMTEQEQRTVLEDQLAAAEENLARLKRENTEAAKKLGLVGFQIESTENQNAAMSRAMSEKDVMIKKNELEMKRKATEVQDLDVKMKSKDAELKARVAELKDLNAKLKIQDAEIKAQNTQSVRKELVIARHVAEIKKQRQQLGARNALINKANPGNDKVGVHGARMAAKDAELATMNTKLAARNAELAALKQIAKEQKALLTKEQQEAVDHQRIIDHHRSQNQAFADAATAREQTIADLRQELVVRKFELTDAQEQRGNRGAIEDIKGKLREMTTLCDRQRAQLKDAKDELKFKEARIMDLSNNGERLRGAIHVVPPRNVKLPETVVSCTECYAMDRRCDSGTKCRPCMENNTECLRFMCSLKYKNGNCPLVPCPLTHDGQGYLMLPRPRPEW